MLKRLAAILVAVTLTTLAGISPAAAYEGETYEELIEDQTLNDQHAIIIRFYAAVFGRTPDNDGVRFWLDQYDTGEWSTRRIANFFATSDEFKSLYGENTSNAEFVDSVYPNVLGRQPDAEGRAFWIGYLDSGNSRAEMILLISNAPEFIETNWLPFELSACELGVETTSLPESEPIDGDDEFVAQSTTITTTTSADCAQVTGFVGRIGWQQGTTIFEGSLTNPASLEDATTIRWKCFEGQEAWIEWSIQSVEILDGEPTLGVLSEGSTRLLCNELPPPPECTFTPNVVLVNSDDLGDGLIFVDLQIDVDVTDCDFAVINSSIEGLSENFDAESTSSPHSPDNPSLLCGVDDSRTYTIRAFDSDEVQIGSDFIFTVEADSFEACNEPN